MSDRPSIASPIVGLPRSPFQRLRELIDGVAPGATPIDLSLGAPRHPFPPFVTEAILREAEGYGHYPPARGSQVFLDAAADWLDRRFQLDGRIDPASNLLVLSGSREGLFTVAFLAVSLARERGITAPVILLPNPFYPVYAAAALAAGAEPFALPATAATGDLPDLEAIPESLLARTAGFYLCSPANPQGSVADYAYLERLAALSETWQFIVFSDECYSEIYRDAPPHSALSATVARDFANILAFNSLSKRSNVPGLRVGLVAGDPALIARFHALRNVVASIAPLPSQAAAAALWRDEAHVAENRRLYNEKFACAVEVLDDKLGHTTPPGGFFLWLDVGDDGEAAALRLWREGGVKVVPGEYLAVEDAGGANPGSGRVRVALVGSTAEIGQALERMVAIVR